MDRNISKIEKFEFSKHETFEDSSNSPFNLSLNASGRNTSKSKFMKDFRSSTKQREFTITTTT